MIVLSCPVLGVFPPNPCTLFGLRHSYGETFAFLKMMNLFRNHSSIILCGLFWPPPLWVKTKSVSPSCHKADYFFDFAGKFCHLHCIFSIQFPTSYYGRLCTFHQSRSIWNCRARPNLNSSTSDFVGRFIFVDERYNATFIKDLRIPTISLGTYWLSAPFFQFSKAIYHIFA